MKKFIMLGLITVLVSNCVIGQQAKTKPFTITAGGFTVTGTYYEGTLRLRTVNGTSILWGMITWGGSSVRDCLPSSNVCMLEVVTSITIGTKGAIVADGNGVKSFQQREIPSGCFPIFIDAGPGSITFAVDINKVSEGARRSYTTGTWKLASPFVLGPEVVKALKMNTGTEEKGFVIPAGEYPLYKDGNIYYWTFNFPKN